MSSNCLWEHLVQLVTNFDCLFLDRFCSCYNLAQWSLESLGVRWNQRSDGLAILHLLDKSLVDQVILLVGLVLHESVKTGKRIEHRVGSSELCACALLFAEYNLQSDNFLLHLIAFWLFAKELLKTIDSAVPIFSLESLDRSLSSGNLLLNIGSRFTKILSGITNQTLEDISESSEVLVDLGKVSSDLLRSCSWVLNSTANWFEDQF